MVKFTYSLQNILMEVILCISLVTFVESTAFPELAKNLRWDLSNKDQEFRAIVVCVLINFILVTLRLPFGSAAVIGLVFGLFHGNPLITEKFFAFGTFGLVIFQILAIIARTFVISRTFQRSKFLEIAKVDKIPVSRVFQNLDQAFFDCVIYYIATVFFVFITQAITKGSLAKNILALQGASGYVFNAPLLAYDIVTLLVGFFISIFATDAIHRIETIITLSHECATMDAKDLTAFCDKHGFAEYKEPTENKEKTE